MAVNGTAQQMLYIMALTHLLSNRQCVPVRLLHFLPPFAGPKSLAAVSIIKAASLHSSTWHSSALFAKFVNLLENPDTEWNDLWSQFLNISLENSTFSLYLQSTHVD
ncbi:hypothetical protein HK096_006968, partial [Nowakowskiella sp. JEL0078]